MVRHFPGSVNIRPDSLQRLSSVARRVFRIFAHAFFHHAAIYADFEVRQRGIIVS